MQSLYNKYTKIYCQFVKNIDFCRMILITGVAQQQHLACIYYHTIILKRKLPIVYDDVCVFLDPVRAYASIIPCLSHPILGEKHHFTQNKRAFLGWRRDATLN